LRNLLPLFPNVLLHLLLRTRPITTLGKSLLCNLPESFNWASIGAIWWPIKGCNLIGFELGFGRLSCMWGSVVHLHDKWGRIKGLVGVKIRIKLHIIVAVELL